MTLYGMLEYRQGFDPPFRGQNNFSFLFSAECPEVANFAVFASYIASILNLLGK